MFDAMVDSIREDTVRMLLTVRLQKNQAPEREQVSSRTLPMQEQATAASAVSVAVQRRSKNVFGKCGTRSGESVLPYQISKRKQGDMAFAVCPCFVWRWIHAGNGL